MLKNNHKRKILKNKKGQSAVEYLTIISIAFIMIIPAVMLFFNYSKTTNDQVISSQLNLIGSQILSTSEEMNVLGTGSWVTLNINFPDSLINASVNNDGQDLVFKYYTTNGESYSVNFAQRFKFAVGAGQCDTGTCDLGFNVGKNSVRIESLGAGKIWLRPNI